jgi:predicted 3-demethylubiquinone-9 3-methyltransferase (glyoxalase superfamily)
MRTAKNKICFWYERDAVEAATFCAKTFSNSSVGAVHHSRNDDPSSRNGVRGDST